MLVCYPQPGKAKSRDILQALSDGSPEAIRTGMLGVRLSAFFGAVGIEDKLHAARELGGWLYGDNSYFDRHRSIRFRFTLDAFQPSTLQPPDHARALVQGIEVRPWRRNGRHIVLVEQSAHFLNLCGAGEDWLARTAAEVQRHTDRPLRIRRWNRDKGGAGATLAADLEDAWALVTHMSAAANEALLAGVPVFVTGACAATPLASGGIYQIETPAYNDGREAWAAGLANSQWTLEELRDGTAWRRLTGW